MGPDRALCQTAHPSMLPPTVTVTQKGARRARAGHPWIFRADVARAPDGLVSGAEVRLADARGNFIGRGFWAVKSPIALPVLSRQDSALDEELLAARLRSAYERRRAMFPGGDAFRLVHGEADLLPGYFADLYDGVAAVQHLAEWAEARREQLARLLVELTGARAVVARENAARNALGNVVTRAQNAIEALRAFDAEGRKFDTIVLDPPAFAKRKEGVEGALRAYREINYRALRNLKPGGLLVTCSCSGRVTNELFGKVVAWASQEAKRPLQLLERRGASRDHPPLIGVPETEYLKAWFLLAP